MVSYSAHTVVHPFSVIIIRMHQAYIRYGDAVDVSEGTDARIHRSGKTLYLQKSNAKWAGMRWMSLLWRRR